MGILELYERETSLVYEADLLGTLLRKESPNGLFSNLLGQLLCLYDVIYFIQLLLAPFRYLNRP